MLKNRDFWVNLLVIIGVFTLTLGILLTFTPLIYQLIGDFYYNQFVILEKTDLLSIQEIKFQRFIYGISGALLISWAFCLAILAHIPLRKGEIWAAWTIGISTLFWFIGDSYISIAMGFILHAWLNISLLMVINIPLFLIIWIDHS